MRDKAAEASTKAGSLAEARLHDAVGLRVREAELRAALRRVGRGHQSQAMAGGAPLADQPGQEAAQRQGLCAHRLHGRLNSQVHAHLPRRVHADTGAAEAPCLSQQAACLA